MTPTHRRPWQTRLVATTLTIVCFSCSHTGERGRSAAHELRIADWSEPTSLNPLLAHDQDTIGLDLLFAQTLVGLSRQNQVVPVLVTRVPSRANGDVSPDGRTIVYHLRRDVRFGDGQILKSSDVAFTFHAIMDPRNPILDQVAYRRIASLATPDAHTVVVRLRAPWNAAVREIFAESDYAFGILPAHAFAGTVLERAPWEEHAFGTGPFRVVQWQRGNRIVLEPNPFFSPRPRLARIEVRMIPDLNAVLIALRTGEADLARISAAQVPQAEELSNLHVVSTALNGTNYLSLQTTASPTDDLRVRRAIADALDVALIEKLFHRQYVRGSAFLSPVLAWHDSALPLIARNGAAAAAQLRAAGWRLESGIWVRNGVALDVLLVAQSGSSGDLNAVVQRELAAVGIRATIKTFSAAAFNGPDGPLRTGRFNIAAQGWIGGSDPEQSVAFACNQIGPGGTNIARFCDRRFDAAFEDQAIVRNDQRRAADFRVMQQIVYDRLPMVPLDYLRYFDAVNVRVRGFARNMLGFPVDAETWNVQ